MDAFRAIARAAEVGREQGREAAMARVRRIGLPLIAAALLLSLGLGFVAGLSVARSPVAAESPAPGAK